MATLGEAPRDRVTSARDKCVALRLLICALAFLGALDGPASAEDPPPEVLLGEAARARLRDEGVYDSLVAAIGRAKYAIQPVDGRRTSNAHAEYEALNPARDLRAAFTPSGVRVHSNGDRKWQFGLELQSIGYGEDLRSLTAGAVTAEDDRLEIRKRTVGPGSSDVVEWYVNTPAGLEHGFTLASRPGRQRVPVAAGDWLRLTLALSGDVRGEVSADRQGVRFKDDHGRHVASYDHLEVWDATGQKLPARMALRGKELSLEVDDRGAQYPVVVDPLVWQEVATSSGDAGAGDQVGFSVAISGNTAIVGCFHDNITDGKVYVFVRDSIPWSAQSYGWRREATLAPPGTKHTPAYGYAVAISGNIAIVGDPLGTFDPDLNPIASAAYVWRRSGGAWNLEKRIEASDDKYTSRFGASVAISGETAVVGAPAWGPFQHNAFRGKAYVFGSNGGWTEAAQLEPDDGNREDEFGTSVSISGDTIIVGAPKHDVVTGTGTNENQGQAYAFVRTSGSWSLPTQLTGSAGAAFDYFGETVGISRNTAVVGAAGPIDPPTVGVAYVFDRSGSEWSETQILAADDGQPGDVFGGAVAIADNTIVVGASLADFNAGPVSNPSQGAAYTFTRKDAVWTQQDKLQADAGQAHDGFGFAVAVGGVGIIVGGPGHDVEGRASQGQAVVFQQLDEDLDGLPDEWEKKGVTIEGAFIDLPKMGANPRHKDIFIHADWMATGPDGAILKPSARAIKLVTDAFAIAPVTNPDGKNGIRLHVDLGPQSIMNPRTGAKWGTLSRAVEVPYQETLGTPGAVAGFYNWSAFDAVKATIFDGSHRRPVFHYALFCHQLPDDVAVLQKPPRGIARPAPSADLTIALATVPQTPNQQAIAIMHELGHNLGLEHGGGDKVNFKPNYLSVMNYRFAETGLLSPHRGKYKRRIEYSQLALTALDETNLNEAVGISDPMGHLTTWNTLTGPTIFRTSPPDFNKCLTNPDSPFTVLPIPALDWDCDGLLTPLRVDRPLKEDINSDGRCIAHGRDANGNDLPLQTTEADLQAPGNDDEIRTSFVTSGPNRICDTAKKVGSTDIQLQVVGFPQPSELKGFDDWAALKFDGGAKLGALLSQDDPDEADTPVGESATERLQEDVPPALLAEEEDAPVDEVTYAPAEGPAALEVDFDGSASTAVIGTIVEWAWDFGDGATGTGAVVSHTYAAPGEYFASLTVTDDGGRENLMPLLHLVTVLEGPPVTATPTPTSTRTPTPVPTPTRTATAPPPTGPTPTPLTTSAVPTPQPTHTSVLGLGDVDPSFTATVASVYGRYVDAVVTQPDHKIIVGGDFASFAGCARRNIARVNADGSCDPTFDPGLALTAVHENQNPGAPQADPGTHRIDLVVKSLALQTDGKVLVGLLGYEGFRGGVLTHDRIIVRLNTDGTIDSSFNAVDVSVGFNSPQSVNTIVIQGDGKILIGGAFLYRNGKIRSGVPYLDGAIARLNSNGSVDSSFVVPDGPDFGGPQAPVYAIALQTDGRVIIGGGFNYVGSTERYVIARLNSDGSFDAGYNAPVPATDGYASGFGYIARVEALALRPDGKVLVGGALPPTDVNLSNSVAVARLNADGSRDTGFVDWRQHGVRALVRQADGKVLIGGDFRTTDPVVRNSIARLEADGGVDLTFDTPGMTGGVHQSNSNQNDVSAIALQSDGQIVVVGRYDNFNHEPAENILQLATNGSRDPGFDSNGAGTSIQVYALVRQPDGKLLVGHQPNGINRSTRLNAARRGGIGRLHADGTTDETFTSPFDANATVFDIVLQPDGKVLVGGFFRLTGSDQNRYFARLNADGTIDAGFVQPSLYPHLVELTGFALQADGKILVNEVNEFNSRRLARLDANGSPDETFSVELSGGGVDHIVVQPDGKLLVTGLVPINGLFARLARLNADGTPDPTFDPGSGPDDGVSSIVLQPDGKILIGGSFSNYDGTPRQQTARVNADGSLDAGFVPATPYTGFLQQVRALALAPDGKVLVGVDLAANGILDALRNRIFRLNADGTVDDSFPGDGRGFERVNTFAYGASIRALLLQPDESLLVGGLFDVVDDVARLGLARLLGPTSAEPSALDHFLFFKTKGTKGASKFAPLGPLTLADTPSTTDVDVQKLVALGVPVEANDTVTTDAKTHLADYALKVRKGRAKFRPLPDVHVENPCSDLVVTLKKPQDLLMPALVDPPSPGVPPTAASHEVADFRCYAVKVQKKRSDGTPLAPFPKGVQLDVDDGFAARRYDLKKLTRLCYPVAESGEPAVLKTGVKIPFTAAGLRHETVHLACYQAKPAKKTITQRGCGPLDPKDKGTKIVPAPSKHQPRRGLLVSSQLGVATLDTAKDLEVCIPSTVTP